MPQKIFLWGCWMGRIAQFLPPGRIVFRSVCYGFLAGFSAIAYWLVSVQELYLATVFLIYVAVHSVLAKTAASVFDGIYYITPFGLEEGRERAAKRARSPVQSTPQTTVTPPELYGV
jgi:hypothetical protein